MANFQISYKKTNGNEGGYAYVDGDTGEETYCGISRKWFPKWAGWSIVDKHKPLKHGQIIKDDALEALKEEFYKEEFWDKLKGDKIESQELADQAYDFAINSGLDAARKLLKQV